MDFEMLLNNSGGDNDIFHPDINTSALEMSWITAAYAKATGNKNSTICNTAAVGKPTLINGLPHFEKAGSQAAYFALDFFLNEENLMKQLEMTPGIKNKTFIIEGLGKIGSNLALYLENAGAMCVGVKEYDGYIYDTGGINIKELLSYKKKYGSITYFGGIKPYQGPEIYKEGCDVLIFAARQKCLMSFCADQVQAKVILEAANGPVPPISHKILTGKKKLIIPDIYACSGASVAAYLEYLLNLKQSGADVSSELNVLRQWCGDNLLHLNLAKCSIMAFTLKRAAITFTYSIGDVITQRPEYVRDLGTWFDGDNSFRHQINLVGNDVSKTIGCIIIFYILP